MKAQSKTDFLTGYWQFLGVHTACQIRLVNRPQALDLFLTNNGKVIQVEGSFPKTEFDTKQKYFSTYSYLPCSYYL